ncbi:hypothetical protein ACLK11_06960 [Escherichia coli]
MALPTINVGDAAIGIVTLGILVFLAASGHSFTRSPSGLAGCLRGDGDC